MSDTVTLTVDGIAYELPLITGAEGERAVDISKLRSTTHTATPDPVHPPSPSSTGNMASCGIAGCLLKISQPARPSSRWRSC